MKQPLPADRVRDLAGGDRGLAAAEVAERRGRHGANDIVETVGSPAAELARETARDPMIWFLVGTAALYVLLAQYAEAITLLVAIAPLAGMDAYLHRRTQASTQGLRGLLADRARVVRDGAEVEIPATEVVVGDLAVVQTGEPFPADGVIVAGSELRADESALTGEAYPVPKRPLAAIPEGTAAADALVDAEHWGFAGTRLLTGRARVRIATIGRETLYGGIVRLATGAARERTPLQRAIGSLVTGLLVAAVILCALLALVRLRQGDGWVEAIVSAATLAVAALPEEFPVVLTVFLGVGVYRLARRKALVSRAVAVENVGRVSCICSDKTGTITEGRLRIARIVPADGYDEAAALAIAAAAARLETGDPLDRAILDAAGRGPGGDVLATFPYTEDRRRETVVIRGAAGMVAYTKGAPETVLAMCSRRDRAAWAARVGELAAAGHKVIACAARRLAEYAGGEPDRDFEPAGLIAIADPVRPEVPRAVAWCRAAGIRVLMLTGDHPVTARAVAREMGLADAPVVRTGEELAGAGDLAAGLVGVDVVARAMPAQKLAIVRALRRAGEIVAVTGDGVNDVPALQAADVGIAMGGKGARSAREVSSIVLLDDNFGSIVAAIAEGRVLFENLRLSFQYLLMIHLPLVLTATFIPLAGYPLLYLPIHIVWIEAIIHPTALLAFQRSDDGRAGTIAPPARGAEVRLFSRVEWAIIVAVGGTITAFVTLAYDRSLSAGDAHARAMAIVVLTAASASMTAVGSELRTRAARLPCPLPERSAPPPRSSCPARRRPSRTTADRKRSPPAASRPAETPADAEGGSPVPGRRRRRASELHQVEPCSSSTSMWSRLILRCRSGSSTRGAGPSTSGHRARWRCRSSRRRAACRRRDRRELRADREPAPVGRRQAPALRRRVTSSTTRPMPSLFALLPADQHIVPNASPMILTEAVRRRDVFQLDSSPSDRQYCRRNPTPTGGFRMRKMSWIAAIVLAGLSVVSVGAQKPDPDAQKIIDQYTAAFNKGDAKGVAALYTADATRVGPDGQLLTGRAAIEKSYSDGFAGAIKGSTLSIQQGRVQVVTPDVKIMEGRFATTGAAGVKGRYVNTAVRQGGAWLLASVVTIVDPAPPAK